MPPEKHMKKASRKKTLQTPPISIPSETSLQQRVWYSRRVIFGIGFVLLWFFCSLTYGDVFRHIGDENFVCTDRTPMFYILRLPYGHLIWAARFLLVPFQNQWLGGGFMALLLTLIAALLETGLPRGSRYSGWGFLPAVGLLFYFVEQDFNLFLRHEPSTFMLTTIAAVGISCIYAAIVKITCSRRKILSSKTIREKTKIKTPHQWHLPLLFLLSIAAYAGLTTRAILGHENVRISCRLQNQLAAEAWDDMIETARKAKHPCRTIAALHAIALEEKDVLIEGMFALPYNFQEPALDDIGGDDEGINYLADCNLHAGLINPAYRLSMENTVVHGPRLHNFKRMAVCALLTGERALAKRYLNLIEKMPFQHRFVAHYRALLNDSTRIALQPTLAHIHSLRPVEEKFEQNYQQPTFLGYNTQIKQGTDAALLTSVAACLYSKNLDAFLIRADALRSKMQLPDIALEAIAIASVKRQGLLEHFPEVTPLVISRLEAFVNEAAPFLEGRDRMDPEELKQSRHDMAETLRANWLGTYMYYYYCGNLNETKQEIQNHGVN